MIQITIESRNNQTKKEKIRGNLDPSANQHVNQNPHICFFFYPGLLPTQVDFAPTFFHLENPIFLSPTLPKDSSLAP